MCVAISTHNIERSLPTRSSGRYRWGS